MSSPTLDPKTRIATVGPLWPKWILALLLGWWTVRLGLGLIQSCFLDLVNLAFHESGHLFFTPFGATMHYLGGSIGQLLVPALLLLYFVIQRPQPLAAAFCFWWLGESLLNVSVYMADARSLALPLVGGGDHDWNELFFRFDLLAESSVRRISTTTHLIGTATMLLGWVWCSYFALPQGPRDALQGWIAARWPAAVGLLEV